MHSQISPQISGAAAASASERFRRRHSAAGPGSAGQLCRTCLPEMRARHTHQHRRDAARRAELQCGLLLKGFVYCHKSTGGGARQILSIHMPGDLLDLQDCAGETAALNVQALTQIRVALIPREALLSVALKYPAVATALWMDTGANASILAEWLLNIGRRDARSRLSHLVCELVVRQGELKAYPPTEGFLMTQEQLGDATALTSVHVNRTLQGLRKDGLIRTDRASLCGGRGPTLRRGRLQCRLSSTRRRARCSQFRRRCRLDPEGRSAISSPTGPAGWSGPSRAVGPQWCSEELAIARAARSPGPSTDAPSER